MKPSIRGADAWIASGLLAVLTLSVFWVLQYYGPESAIRRFHVATLSGDLAELQQVTSEDVGDPAVLSLREKVYLIAKAGGTFELGRMGLDGRSVTAEVRYRIPRLGILVTVWLVQKPPSDNHWKINATRTLANFRALGL
ncbi:MAG: hypothetical protein M9921_12985 [Fimbriimonadaceae bacterium]|nr:hypothetical protein [Fimbriimonadaceae bacterium]